MNEFTIFTLIGMLCSVFFAVIFVYAVYRIFLLPYIEVVSIARFETACIRKSGGEVEFGLFLDLVCKYYYVFGRDFESIRNRYGQWHGLFDWYLYEDE